ncbi:hypothetical protein BZA70DRAFT_307438 [Myxozyma melibiosi]|uniref:Phospholipid/glycerol acyltransferase domain-containing protein n=1 Tax=Myxozyma melibiosi TaxID=54550 RepID=A0ABR1F1I0_9ASCO
MAEPQTNSAIIESNGTTAVKAKKRSIDKEPGSKAFFYDLIVGILSVTFDLFFREIKSRGAFNIPTEGPLVFVAAPHANQFIDPLLLMRQILSHSGRRVSFLTASKSLRHPLIGPMARMSSPIAVDRAQDLAAPATGQIYIAKKDQPLKVNGKGTKFTKELEVGGMIMLPNSLGYAPIAEIISDEELVLKAGFKEKAFDFVHSGPTAFKKCPKVSHEQMFENVFDHLHKGGCIGVFPEGGSHDRPDMLPLKAGAAIMALGAAATDANCNVKIVPCGLNYFHPNKFRSRAVIEFGTPIELPRDLVAQYAKGGEEKHKAIAEMLDTIQRALLTVTVTCSDYDTLMVIQAARRLYKPIQMKVPLSIVIEMNRRLLVGYNQFRDDPRIIHLREAVAAYNKQLQNLGITDHQVEYAKLSVPEVMGKLLYRTSKLVILAIGALPGTLLFAPIFIATKHISKRKAEEALKASTVKLQGRDVVGTWKILVALVLAPALDWVYALMATWITYRYDLFPQVRPLWLITLGAMIVLPMITYAALRIGEVGMDIFKSLNPLVTCLNPFYFNAMAKLKLTREDLAKEVTEAIDVLGPEVFSDFEKFRMIHASAVEETKKTK